MRDRQFANEVRFIALALVAIFTFFLISSKESGLRAEVSYLAGEQARLQQRIDDLEKLLNDSHREFHDGVQHVLARQDVIMVSVRSGWWSDETLAKLNHVYYSSGE